jgi:cysteinyl-tRNA synthetase
MLNAADDASHAETGYEDKLDSALESAKKRFSEAMDDDFNTADSLGVIFDLARSCNVYLREGHPYNRDLLDKVIAFYREINEIFEILDLEEPRLLDDQISGLIKKRDEARAAKDFVSADQIRDKLAGQGIILEDTPHGTRWKRK